MLIRLLVRRIDAHPGCRLAVHFAVVSLAMMVTMAHSSKGACCGIVRHTADSKALENGVTSIPGAPAGKRERLDREHARPLPLPSADSNDQPPTGGAVEQPTRPGAEGFSKGQSGEGKKPEKRR